MVRSQPYLVVSIAQPSYPEHLRKPVRATKLLVMAQVPHLTDSKAFLAHQNYFLEIQPKNRISSPKNI
jgi:hypothetical protein